MPDIDASLDFYIARIGFLENVNIIRGKLTAPHVLLKPKFGRDGNQYYFLYGDNLQEGVAGFGDTPEKAAEDFDNNWSNDDVSKLKPLLNVRED